MKFTDRVKKAIPVLAEWTKGKGLSRTFIRQAVIAGAAAGSHTGVTTKSGQSIEPGDKIVSVQLWLQSGTTPFAMVPSDLTSEFSITGAGTIDNTGGSASTGGYLVVTWESWAEDFT